MDMTQVLDDLGVGNDSLTEEKKNELDERGYTVLPGLINPEIFVPNVGGFQFCHMAGKKPALTYIPFLFLTSACVSVEEDDKPAFGLGANR
mgnify:CR=1 FL=1